MIRVLLVDDHPVVREGVATILGDDSELAVVAQAATGDEALALGHDLHPDVAIVDIRLPGADGIEVCAALRERHPRIRVLMLTSYPNERVMLRSFTAGARGFVAKEAGPQVLREAVHAVAAGGTFIDPSVAGKLVSLATQGRRAKGPYGLTLQEMRVLELIPKGLTNLQIGQLLGVGEKTVKSHVHHAMRKLRVSNRAEAAAVAQREGLA